MGVSDPVQMIVRTGCSLDGVREIIENSAMKFSVLALLLLFSFSASAGPDVVNNGGGLSEAKAYSLLLKLDDFARVCLTSCGLTSQQAQELEDLRKELSNHHYRIEFDKSFQLSRLDGELYQLSHRDLYDEVGLSKNAGAIVGLLFRLQAEQIGHSNDWIEPAFSRFEERTVSLPLGTEGTLHVIRFTELASVVILEKDHDSIAMTPKIESAIGCFDSYQLGDFSAISVGNGRSMAEAPIEWTCQGQAMFAKLRLFDGSIEFLGVTQR